MAYFWNWYAIPGLLAAGVAFLLAAMVYSASPRRLQNRFLALTLVVEGAVNLSGSGLMYMTSDPDATYAWQLTTYIVGFTLTPLYFLFLSTVLSPLSRPLARPAVRWTLAGLAVAGALAGHVMRDHLIVGVEPSTIAPYDSIPGPWFLPVVFLAWGLPGLFGLAVAVSAYRGTRQLQELRRQATWYLAAFAIRDLGHFVVLVSVFTGLRLMGGFELIFLPAIVTTTFALVLGYGILKAQLFDVDLRIQTGLRRTALAGAFVLAFLVGSQLVQNVTNETFGLVGGALVSGLLLFFLRPLERTAQRLAEAAMPGVRPTPGYIGGRKRTVFRHALESALSDGQMTAKERRTLIGLANDLGLSADEAMRLELQVLDRLPGHAARSAARRRKAAPAP